MSVLLSPFHHSCLVVQVYAANGSVVLVLCASAHAAASAIHVPLCHLSRKQGCRAVVASRHVAPGRARRSAPPFRPTRKFRAGGAVFCTAQFCAVVQICAQVHVPTRSLRGMQRRGVQMVFNTCDAINVVETVISIRSLTLYISTYVCIYTYTYIHMYKCF